MPITLVVFVALILLVERGTAETVEFSHEICTMETLTSNAFKELHPAEPSFNAQGVLELFVRFKGPADGHIVLSANQNVSDLANRYTISIGSYNNKVSEMRREKQPEKLEFKINTPGILTTYQYRGFVVRYSPVTGEVSVFSEGGDLPLLHLTDPNPLQIKFFGFATWHNRVTQAAFNCRAKDDHSAVSKRDSEYVYGRAKKRNGTRSAGLYNCCISFLISAHKKLIIVS